ncbi:MAG: VOC family protein [Pseudomonadales bacterium]|nr:VOC family protein [Pseudomonadales bacterium]MBO6563369.1 VOC family protein [Pseudomonadales bacterium]MBO6596231.1 VOC family protein [Pseudomonadales bacterium]MBO6657232.1 VOC family protein [Pseudomonadales bacterium]MBO6702842.1 VOC family protein [Pseudomonadales bacterium]
MLGSYPLFQHAYFVRDVRNSCEEWSKLFGAGPFVVTEHHKAERFTYRGTDVEADVTYAFGYLGDLMIQFIQQHDDQPSIYRDMYAEGAEGFHHIAYLVRKSEWSQAKSRLEAMGFECACELTAGGVFAAYYDTRSVTGGFTEIHDDSPRIISAFASWRHRHQFRQPEEGAIMERPPITS